MQIELRPENFRKPLVDHRIYTLHPRRTAAFLDVFNRLAMPVLMETLGAPLGFYLSCVGRLNQFVHLWGYDDLADYERRSRVRDSHPDFPAYLSASEGMILTQESQLVRPVLVGPTA
jgi:hypothetical protein